MDGAAVKELRDMAAAAETKTIEVDGVTYSTYGLHHVPRRREEGVDAIELSSLQGIVDYLELQKDGLSTETHFLHVEGPTAVRVVGPLLGQGETNQRHVYLEARHPVDPFPWDRAVQRQAMQILLQARFRETEDRGRALRIIGNLVSEESLKQEDDGMTQRVTAKSGVALVEEISVENPFQLAPFRTFPEIEAPESPFVLRLEPGAGGVTCRLIEADGGFWQVVAVQRIAEWLGGQTEFRVIS